MYDVLLTLHRCVYAQTELALAGRSREGKEALSKTPIVFPRFSIGKPRASARESRDACLCGKMNATPWLTD